MTDRYQFTQEEAHRVTTQSAPQVQQRPASEAYSAPQVANVSVTDYTGNAMRVSMADLAPAGAILSTARDTAGHVATNPKPSDLVTVAGIQMSVEQAESFGYLTKDANGRYVEASPSAKAQQQSTSSPQDAYSKAPALAPEALHTLNSIGDVMGDESLQAMAQEYISGNGELSSLNDWAYRAGKTPEEMAQAMHDVHLAFHDQAARYVSSRYPGIDAVAVFDHAVNTLPESAIQEIFRRHVFGNDLSVYDKLVSHYRSTAGATSGGEELIEVGGVQVARNVAIQMGII